MFVFSDVVAYVEVRSDQDNRSQAIERQLQLLGATIAPKFTSDVTHVVFKDGRKMTREKATKKNLHLVSVLWVDRYLMLLLITLKSVLPIKYLSLISLFCSCKKSQERVPESLFPVNIPDDRNTPLCLQKVKVSTLA